MVASHGLCPGAHAVPAQALTQPASFWVCTQRPCWGASTERPLCSNMDGGGPVVKTGNQGGATTRVDKALLCSQGPAGAIDAGVGGGQKGI